MKISNMQNGSLKNVHIEAVWGHKDFEWNNIDPEVNIVVGINGSGKTTLLNLICAELEGDASLIRKYQLHYLDLEYYDSVTPNDFYFIRSFDNPSNDKRKNESRLQQELNYVLYQNKDGFSFFNYRMKILNEPERATEVQNHINLLFEIVNSMFAETGKTISISKDSELVFNQNGTILKVDDLSSGERQLLLLLVSVFLQDNQPSILLADEPEVSLHISWQQVLIDNLKRLNPNCQLIIATHSPSIISRGWGDKVVQMNSIVK